jgi:hypothetical protein
MQSRTARITPEAKYDVTFAVNFEVSNPATKKRVVGTAVETEILAPDASGNKRIISQHEKITTSHRSDGNRSKTPDASEETVSKEKGLKSENGERESPNYFRESQQTASQSVLARLQW